ncbi:MAG TPA: hypothetical protein VG317_17285 [Pseudonocardiaceae bacterium]|nr:hypothetical protein [Pseudonocardiaceae bacterium]
MKRWVLTIVGVVFIGIGVGWTLQGAGILAGSAMSGKTLWLVIGLVVGVAGIGALAGGLRDFSARDR